MKSFDVAGLLDISETPSHLQKVQTELIRVTTTDNPALAQPLTRLVGAGSKRLRSLLVIAVADSQGKRIDDTVIAGCVAIELVHIASLVHDDIIDHADTRWGIPTVNSKEGVNQAILVGDFLLAKAGEVAASINADAARLISATMAALIDGESREVADEFNLDRTIKSMRIAIRGKTGALVSAACQMGGICADVNKQNIQALAAYGESFGMAFQLVDDILDFVSSEQLMGKPVGNDIKEGVYTLPLLLALQGEHSAEVRRILSKQPADIAGLKSFVIENGYIEETLQEVTRYNQQAKKALDDIRNSSNLSELPDKYLRWALDNLVDRSVVELGSVHQS